MNTYRLNYTEREPDPSKTRNEDECIQLLETQGVIQIRNAQLSGPVYGIPPRDRSERDNDRNKYIWVILNESEPMILEKSEAVEFLESKRATHTNLTGCKKAYCGGEIWFQAKSDIYISGASGRYPPRDDQELKDICAALTRLDYNVKSLGWDRDRNAPHALLRD